jgi:hypothetical protein
MLLFKLGGERRRRNVGGLDLPDHIYEQIIWRRTKSNGKISFMLEKWFL